MIRKRCQLKHLIIINGGAWLNYPKDRFLAGVAGLREVGLVAGLTEDLLILKDKGGVLQRLMARTARKVLRVPHPPHRTRKWTSAGLAKV